ncbi:MAG: glycerophosphodiester phosphodiesterase [Clostridiales bacterium]|nr:glycerophosphodiester phosphodiesterase [Clostridiales bacterium]
MLIDLLLVIGALGAIYLILIMPRLGRNPDAKKMKGWLYAHRGIHSNKNGPPENSTPAFLKAVERRYGIELDVQLTKDGIPVVFHDYNLLRACGVDFKVADLTYKELRRYRLFNSSEMIPTFAEVLAVVNGRVPLIIELKIPFDPKPLCRKVYSILHNYKGFYSIESFNPLGLIWYKKYKPNILRGQLSTDFVKEQVEGNKIQHFLLRNLLLNFMTRPDYIAYNHKYKDDFSFKICKKLFRPISVAWTISSQEELDNSIKDFDLFIFEKFIPQGVDLKK